MKSRVKREMAARLAPAEHPGPRETMAPAVPEPPSEWLVPLGPTELPASQVLVPRIEIARAPPPRPSRTP